MDIQIKIDGVKYGLCKDCGVYHKASKAKRNNKKVVCSKK